MVTTVKTRMALLFDSAMMASSFCSMVRSWKSWVWILLVVGLRVGDTVAYHVQRAFEVT